MIKPLALFVGLRYTRAKKRTGFISFISLASMLGIALGVMVLITVLSVMNGFDDQIKSQFFKLAPQVTVSTMGDMTGNWKSLASHVAKVKHVVASAPFVNGNAMLTFQGQVSGAIVVGVDPKQEPKVSDLGGSLVAGKLSSLQPGKFNIILGQDLANRLGVTVGDSVVLLTPQANITPVGMLPRFRQFHVSGIFHAGGGFGFTTAFGYVNLQDGQKMFLPGKSSRGLHIKLDDAYNAPWVTLELQKILPPEYLISNWTIIGGDFFKAVQMEKTMMFLVLLLIIGVATFNLVSTMVMLVNDKRADIAILRTLGATPGWIMRTFLVVGLLVGTLGTLLGVIAGIILSLNVTSVVNWIQQVFHVQLINKTIFWVDFLPSQLQTSDVVEVAAIAFLLSLLATIYPAWTASRTQPAEALRYE